MFDPYNESQTVSSLDLATAFSGIVSLVEEFHIRLMREKRRTLTSCQSETRTHKLS